MPDLFLNITKYSLPIPENYTNYITVTQDSCVSWCKDVHFKREFQGLYIFYAALIVYIIKLSCELAFWYNEKNNILSEDIMKKIINLHDFCEFVHFPLLLLFALWMLLKWKYQVGWLG